jgi:Xaa-Pro aminopeptidase
MNHSSRLAALRARLDSPLLVSRLPNVRYLTGFTGSSAFLLVDPDGTSHFITDGRYGESSEPLVDSLEETDLVVYGGGVPKMWDVFRSVIGDAITLEADGVMWSFAREFAKETGIEPQAGGGVVEELRRAKDEDELKALEAAASAGDDAFAALNGIAEDAMTERDLGWALVGAMRARGGEPADWDPIVAAGPAASVPHHSSGSASLGDGLLLLDFGCVVQGYHSDMSRTVWLSGEPDDDMKQVHQAVLESQQAGIDAVRSGVACGAVDDAVREVLRKRGYEEQFLHSTGHGVGLEIHERPWVRRGNDEPLQTGDVITIEPGVYLPGRGGVRIEDMVLVTDDGGRVLTSSPRTLTTA